MSSAAREHRRRIAADTVTIVNSGFLPVPNGAMLDIRSSIQHMLENMRFYPAEHPIFAGNGPHRSRPSFAAAAAQSPYGTMPAGQYVAWSPHAAQPFHQPVIPTPRRGTTAARHQNPAGARIEFRTETTLESTFKLQSRCVKRKVTPNIGVLNFASATKPGGGWRSGAQAQEESLARASALWRALDPDAAGQAAQQRRTVGGGHRRRSYSKQAARQENEVRSFYEVNARLERQSKGWYSHGMIWTPAVKVFKDDDGRPRWPVDVDIITCPAVNAKDVREHAEQAYTRQSNTPCSSWFSWAYNAPINAVPTPWVSSNERTQLEQRIKYIMTERMFRILLLFEEHGVQHLVLGAFGTGVFQNNLEMVASAWSGLLCAENARFRHSFASVVFAIPGQPTMDKFKTAFYGRSRL